MEPAADGKGVVVVLKKRAGITLNPNLITFLFVGALCKIQCVGIGEL